MGRQETVPNVADKTDLRHTRVPGSAAQAIRRRATARGPRRGLGALHLPVRGRAVGRTGSAGLVKRARFRGKHQRKCDVPSLADMALHQEAGCTVSGHTATLSLHSTIQRTSATRCIFSTTKVPSPACAQGARPKSITASCSACATSTTVATTGTRLRSAARSKRPS